MSWRLRRATFLSPDVPFGNVEGMKQDFEYRCRQCCRVEELFAQLQELQELLLRETGELRKARRAVPSDWQNNT